MARQYRKVLQIFFVDGDTEMFELEVEPAIKEAWKTFRGNSDRDARITAESLDSGHIQFLCSDILTMAEIETATPEYHLLYPARLRMFELGGRLFYEADEADILGVLCLDVK